MGVDEHWRPVTEWSIVSDTRFMPHAVAMQQAAHKAILSLSGTNLPVLGAKILWWRKSFPDSYARAAKFIVIGGYIAAKLGGIGIGDAFIDRTYLNFTASPTSGGTHGRRRYADVSTSTRNACPGSSLPTR